MVGFCQQSLRIINDKDGVCRNIYDPLLTIEHGLYRIKASLVISQSSVRGLSDARRALATARRELNATGANASVIETAATRARERICMVEVKVKELSLIFMKWRYARCEKR